MALYIFFCLISAQILKEFNDEQKLFFFFFFVGIHSCFIFSEDKENPQFEMS